MGWLWLALLGLGAMAALLLLGIDRRLRAFVAAGLLLAAAGYTLQGSPGLPASSAKPAPPEAGDDAELIALRAQMLGRYTADDIYLFAADALTRAGDRHGAAQVLLGGLHAMPRSLALWTALGTALAAHDGDTVSPSALFAFQQAGRLGPTHPAPPFFLGMAAIRAGDFVAARTAWSRALALTPPRAAYRDDIAERVALIDRYLATAKR